MDNFRVYKGMPPLTEEELAEIEANAPKSDDEIDYSDIPPITHEEFQRAFARRRARLQAKNLKIAS